MKFKHEYWWLSWITFVVTGSFLAIAAEAIVAQEKEEAAVPLTSLAPPEGNTTFIGGTTWCVALAGVAQMDLQNALDWACGRGKADCRPIQAGGRCFEPDTLLSHASFAFNTYYQQNGNNDIACNFGGTAIVTKNDPSYDRCMYESSKSMKSSSAPPQISKQKSLSFNWWGFASIVLFLH